MQGHRFAARPIGALRSRGHARRAVVMASITALVGVLFVLPAFAWHPILSGQTACSNGDHVVTWTIGNSETAPTSPMTIVSAVAMVGANAYPVTGYTTPVPPAGSTLATTIVPGGVTGVVVLTVFATWPNKESATRTTSVDLGPICTEPTTSTTSTSTTSTSTTTTSTTTTTTVEATTTTTEAPTTTTTEAPTTTTSTVEPTTTTTTEAPTTTTSTVEPTTTTTTEERTTTTTTVPESTTIITEASTVVSTSTTTVPGTVSTEGTPTSTVAGPATLPFTGSDGWPIAVGIVSLGLGAALSVFGRRRRATI